jgi:hypothetical protein
MKLEAEVYNQRFWPINRQSFGYPTNGETGLRLRLRWLVAEAYL